jgi:hypothetical protein
MAWIVGIPLGLYLLALALELIRWQLLRRDLRHAGVVLGHWPRPLTDAELGKVAMYIAEH